MAPPRQRRAAGRLLPLLAASAVAGGAFVGGGPVWHWRQPAANAAAPVTPRGGLPARRAVGDDEKFYIPNEKIVEAVQGLGGRVTKADVLERGVPAAGLEQELVYLAKASGASLTVNDKGELLFDFPSDLKGALSSKSTAVKLQQAWQTVQPWLGWAGRVAFGVSLLATVAVLYSAVVILLTAQTSERRDNRSGESTTFVSPASWFGSDIFFWLMPRPYGYYSYGGWGMYGTYFEPPPKMSFFEAVFSFVFGDGDPNKQLRDETRWQLIGEAIAQNGGSVIADQVAPYLDPPEAASGSPEDRRRALDQAMLPVLLRFKGRPEVDDAGDIIYVFPELQESRAAGELIVGEVPTKELKMRLGAMGRRTTAVERPDIISEYRSAIEALRKRVGAPPALAEQKVKFSEADDGQIAGIVAFGGFAFLATLFFGTQIISGKALILARVYPIIGLVVQGFPFLLAYVSAFLAIPGLRFASLGSTNDKIAERNAWRQEKAASLEKPDNSLLGRIRSAANWARGRKAFGDAIYNSSESVTESKGRSELDDLKKFDQQLNGRS